MKRISRGNNPPLTWTKRYNLYLIFTLVFIAWLLWLIQYSSKILSIIKSFSFANLGSLLAESLLNTREVAGVSAFFQCKILPRHNFNFNVLKVFQCVKFSVKKCVCAEITKQTKKSICVIKILKHFCHYMASDLWNGSLVNCLRTHYQTCKDLFVYIFYFL